MAPAGCFSQARSAEYSPYSSFSSQPCPRALPTPLTAIQLLPPKTSSPMPTERAPSRFTREWLESKGVTLDFGYRGETFTNLQGGLDSNRGANFLGSADTTIIFNLSKLRLGRGAIVVSAQSLHGRGINDRKVGAMQAASNLDDAHFNKFVEVYFTDSFAHERFTFKAGRLYADADFNVIENGGDFLNAAYGLIPTIPMPTSPAPQFGASLWTKATSWLSLGGGAYRGVSMDVDGDEPVQLYGPLHHRRSETLSRIRRTPPSMAAIVSASGNRTAAPAIRTIQPRPPATTASTPPAITGSTKRRPPAAMSGPGVFFQLGWSPSDRNLISRYWGAGVAYPSFSSRRSQDSIGLGVTQARLPTGKNETVTEAFYKIQATKKVFVQPDLQWVNRPSGDGRNASTRRPAHRHRVLTRESWRPLIHHVEAALQRQSRAAKRTLIEQPSNQRHAMRHPPRRRKFW